MKFRTRIIFTGLVLMLLMLSCNLPVRSINTGSDPESASQPEYISGNSTIDLSHVRLEQSDLPTGFSEMSEEEMAQYGFDSKSLLAAISSSLAKAEPQNLAVFVKPGITDTTIVMSFLIQPLTTIEKGAFDLLARNPQQAVTMLSNAAEDLTFTPQTEIESIGDATMGVLFTSKQSTIPLAGNLVIYRRDQVVQISMIAYMQGGNPAISATEIARIMDSKIKALLE